MDFVTFELANKLKEKGFPQRTFGEYDMMGACYFKDGRFYEDGCIAHIKDCCTAPQMHKVLKWLREEKKVEIVVSFDYEDKTWGYQVGDMTLTEDSILAYRWNFPTYEQAALAGIEYVLDNLI